MCMAVLRDAKLAQSSVKYRPVVTKMYWISCVVHHKGPKTSIAIMSSGLVARKRCSSQWWYVRLFFG